MAKHNPTSKKTGDYEVGYKKPPKRNQFQPGQSGDPTGSAPQTITGWLKQFAGQSQITAQIEMRKDKEPPKVVNFSIKNGQGPIRALVALQLIKGAVEGDLAFIREVLDRTEGKAKQEIAVVQKGRRRVVRHDDGTTEIILE